MSEKKKNNSEFSTEREVQYGQYVMLLSRHDQAIRRFIRSLMPSSEGVDDVMQETALESWRKFSDFQPATQENSVEEFIRWACVIARYKAMSWQRDKSRDRLVFREGVVEQLAQEAMDSSSLHTAERNAIETCLGKLDEVQRRLVLSVHSPRESVSKIAAETGEKSRRLYSQVNRLRKLLLECVQKHMTAEMSHG